LEAAPLCNHTTTWLGGVLGAVDELSPRPRDHQWQAVPAQWERPGKVCDAGNTHAPGAGPRFCSTGATADLDERLGTKEQCWRRLPLTMRTNASSCSPNKPAGRDNAYVRRGLAAAGEGQFDEHYPADRSMRLGRAGDMPDLPGLATRYVPCQLQEEERDTRAW
jgi:hypothetical protein